MFQGMKIGKFLASALVAAALAWTSSMAVAEDKKGGSDESGFVTEKRKDGTTIKYKKKTTYDFEGTNVEGLYNKPSGSYISNIKDVKAKTIMRIRKNFDAEVVDSARMVK
jgi:hypothetical protein